MTKFENENKSFDFLKYGSYKFVTYLQVKKT